MSLLGISLIIAFHGIVIAAALFRMKFGDERPYFWLSISLLLLSGIILFSPDIGIFSQDRGLEIISVLYFLIGPVFLAFIRNITGNSLSKKMLFYLSVPAILAFGIFGISYIPLIYDIESLYTSVEIFYDWNWIASAILESVCIVFGFIAVIESKHRTEYVSAGDEPLLAGKLNVFLAVYAVLFTADLIQEIIHSIFELPVIIYAYLPPIFSALWFALIAYLLISDAEKYRKFQSTAVKGPKYEKTGLSESDANLLYNKAEEYVKSEKFYCNPECTLPSLAEKLVVTTHDLSQAINSGGDKNFAGFINAFRVEMAKKLLTDKSVNQLNVLEISFQSGFSSKATFNRVFRDFTGESPTAYRKNYQQTS